MQQLGIIDYQGLLIFRKHQHQLKGPDILI